MTSILSPMHQASLIGQNIIVTTGCSSSHLPLAGPSSAFPLPFCLTHAPFHGRMLAPSRHACFLSSPHTHFSQHAPILRLLLALPHFPSLRPWALCESTGTGRGKPLSHTAILSFVCIKKSGQSRPFCLFPCCLHQFMKVS